MGVEHVAIVIPVRNEQDLLPRCLTAVSAAIDNAPQAVAVSTILVLDSCTDDSGAVAEAWPFETLVVTGRTVGSARAAGADLFLSRTTFDHESVWLANTDADSAVPVDWLAHQVELANAGAALVLGAVRPDGTDLSVTHRRRWRELHPTGISRTGDVYGANLGIRASAYRAAGGFDAVPEHEDVRLVSRVRGLGMPVVSTLGHPVLTSSRSRGRTPGGYAGYLRDDLLKI